MGRQPLHGLGQIVDPESHMVERRAVHSRFFFDVQRLHQIDLDLERATAHGANIFIHILAFADKVAGDLKPQQINPQRPKTLLAGSANGYLLDTQYLERPVLSLAKGPVLSLAKGPVLSLAKGPV